MKFAQNKWFKQSHVYRYTWTNNLDHRKSEDIEAALVPSCRERVAFLLLPVKAKTGLSRGRNAEMESCEVLRQ